MSGKKPPPPRSRKPARKPPLRVMTTTHWEYPSQHYDSARVGGMQGDKKYAGATPSWVIWQLLTRYTREGDTVLDPMCGSGTTLDVCRDLKRRGVGFDLQPQRESITLADARSLPVDDASADFFFVDPPYSTHIEYSDDPRCIGKLDAGGEDSGEAYYESMRAVIGEAHRVLRDRRYMALYVSDSYKKGKPFMPIGFELFSIMRESFRPVDIVSVVRQNAKLTRGNWHKAAREGNYFLRGFNYLFIMKKEEEPGPERKRARTERTVSKKIEAKKKTSTKSAPKKNIPTPRPTRGKKDSGGKKPWK